MRKVLIVDDEPDICDCLESFFSMQGFSASSALTGERALSLLKQDHNNAIDVVLLDIALPGVSGIEVLRKIRELKHKAKVIMVTALDRDDLRETANSFGADDYITKPFDFSEETWVQALV